MLSYNKCINLVFIMLMIMMILLGLLTSCDEQLVNYKPDRSIDAAIIIDNNTVSKPKNNEAIFIPEDKTVFPPPEFIPLPDNINFLDKHDDDDCGCYDKWDCTLDYCEKDNSCTFIPKDDLCNNDNIFCNGLDICDPKYGCVPGPLPCDDNILCTVDQCDEASKSCTHIPNNNLCQNPCLIDAICDPHKGCIGGINPCDDNIDCTIDSCDTEGHCVHVPNNNLCEQTFCSPQICNITTGCELAPNPCDDDIICTLDTCNEDDRSCTHTPSDALCRSNNDFCRSLDTCDVNQGCLSGVSELCNDNIACTIDTCSNGACVRTANDDLCQTGVFCNAKGICDITENGCIYPDIISQCDDNITCTVDFCDFNSTNKCINLADNSQCSSDPNDWCNGTYCNIDAGGCGSYEPPCQLDDNIDCTLDYCYADLYPYGQPFCVHQERDNFCPTGSCAQGKCSSAQGCILINYNDQICINQDPPSSCYVDRYCKPDGQCNFIRDDSLCQRPITETNCVARCDFYDGCIDGSDTHVPPFSCNDNKSCTYDFCDGNNKCAGNIVLQGQCNVDPTCSKFLDCEVDINRCPTQSYSAQCRDVNGDGIWLCEQNCPVTSHNSIYMKLWNDFMAIFKSI